MLRSFTTAGLALLLSACASVYPPAEVERILAQARTSAEALVRLERHFEAAQFVRAAARIDPDFEDRAELEQSLGDKVQVDFSEASWLGVNRARRYPISRDLSMKALLYLPDRSVTSSSRSASTAPMAERSSPTRPRGSSASGPRSTDHRCWGSAPE